MGIIYKATCSVTNKSYIGLTSFSLTKRKGEHRLKSKLPKTHFHKAINKYGFNSFEWIILEECSNELLSEREVYYINKYNTFNTGYNETNGGNTSLGSKKHSEEQKIKFSKIMLGNTYALGNKISKETKDQRYKTRKNNGKPWHNEETIKKMNITKKFNSEKNRLLTYDQRKAIRQLYATGAYSQYCLAKHFGCSRAGIKYIIMESGESYGR